MDRVAAPRGLRGTIWTIIPAPAGRRTFPRAFASLLTFGLTALGAEWMVHQLEYLIEYGNRFVAVMQAPPHRTYMGALGALLAMGGVILVTLIVSVLLAAHRRRQALLRGAPVRLRSALPIPGSDLPARTILTSALALAGCQIVLYLAQENVESLTAFGLLPGLAVLFAPVHATVVPLHLLAALCGSILLWSITGSLRRSRQAVQLARLVAALLAARRASSPRCRPPRRGYHLCRRCPAGTPGLRAPPLPA